jgi:hypothetical protein
MVRWRLLGGTLWLGHVPSRGLGCAWEILITKGGEGEKSRGGSCYPHRGCLPEGVSPWDSSVPGFFQLGKGENCGFGSSVVKLLIRARKSGKV